MPYIKEIERDFYLEIKEIFHPGKLNYLFTYLIDLYVRENGLKYQTCNDIVGALENAKHEFQRRIQDPYENTKIEENGDVYSEEFLNGGK